jgi:hypothetical protein
VYLLKISNNAMMAESEYMLDNFAFISKFSIYSSNQNLRVRSLIMGLLAPFWKTVATQKFVAKMQSRHIKKKGLRCVGENAISKLNVVLGVGPEIKTIIPFDVVVYTDAIQFHLKICEKYSNELLWKYG